MEYLNLDTNQEQENLSWKQIMWVLAKEFRDLFFIFLVILAITLILFIAEGGLL